MFVIPQTPGGADYDEKPALLFIFITCILLYSCVTVTFGDETCGFMAGSQPYKETETEGPAPCVFTHVDKNRERIVVGQEIYIVIWWYQLDTSPRKHRVQVYENTRAALAIRRINLSLGQIEDLRKRRTDPDDRVGGGTPCWPASRVILASECLKSNDVNINDNK